jgi:hypothetical protein
MMLMRMKMKKKMMMKTKMKKMMMMSSSSSGVSQSCSNFVEKIMGLVEENDSGIGGFLGLQGVCPLGPSLLDVVFLFGDWIRPLP